ncbi:hypothetical protein [Winogradskyella sp. PC D3.3]
MSRCLFFLVFLVSYSNTFSQDNSYVNNNSSFDKSYDTNEGVTIPLYNIDAGGFSIPIYLSYNTIGQPLTEVPSSVGFNWQLIAGGKIRKQINHLSDESKDGWFFNNRSDDYQEGFYHGTNTFIAEDLFEKVDASPDLFEMQTSNGEYIEYLYDRSPTNYLHAVILNQNGNFSSRGIFTDFQHLQMNGFEDPDYEYYTDDNHCEIQIKNNQGVNYLFRKGIKRARPFELDRQGRRTDSLDYQNYYLHKVTTDRNSKEIKFEYIDSKLKKLIPHTGATRRKTNSDPYNPPAPGDPIVADGYFRDISVEDVSRKDVSKITTDNQTIQFTYKFHNYNNSLEGITPSVATTILNSLTSQSVKLLDEIKIYDTKGRYVSGYKFFYTNQTQNPGLYEGDLKIKYITKLGRNQKDSYVYKKFDYYYGARASAMSLATDVFGYYNGEIYNGNCPTIHPQCFYKLPNESEMIKGMLKSVTNKNGGVTEYEYVENSFGDMYYGGLLVSAVIKKDNDDLLSRTEYTYEDPEGFGLPVYDNNQYEQLEIPPNVYEDGFFEFGYSHFPWFTYYTRIDPKVEYLNLRYLTVYGLSSVPYSYLRNTPTLDYIYNQELQLQDLNQVKFGSFYSKVTSKKFNVINGVSEKGHMINYYRPSMSSYNLEKILFRKEYYNNNNEKIKEEKYNYEVKNIGGVDSFKFDNVHLHQTATSSGAVRYVIKNNYRYIFEDVLRSEETIEFDDSNEITKHFISSFTYLNEENSTPDYTRVKEVINSFNNIPFEKIEFKYLADFQQEAQHLQYLQWFINPVFEKNHWVKSANNWKLKGSQINDFLQDGKLNKTGSVIGNSLSGSYFDETNYTPPYYDASENLISLGEDFIEYTYDTEGHLKSESNLRTQTKKIYQRSDEYDGLYVDAILITNADVDLSSNIFIKKSFEGLQSINIISFDRAFSGKQVFNGSSLELGNYSEPSKVSFWGYHNDKWRYYSYSHTGGPITITKPPEVDFIDEVRVQPLNSSMHSFTYLPLVGVTSSLDDSGLGERTEYDLFGNPLYLFDKDYNILKEFRYNSELIEIND